jgi:GNAT superfamily N-acetyltransferase
MFATKLAQLHDINFLIEMMDEFYAESDYQLNHQEAESSFSLLLSDACLGCIWIAVVDSQNVGYVVMTKRFSMEYGGLVAEIDDLFVRKEWRGKNAGKLLVTEVFQHCKAQNILAVRVEVGTDNQAAQNLYQQFGLLPYEDNRQALIGKVRSN